jgi:hypothetical protein
MTQKELIRDLSPLVRKLYRVIEQHGPLGAPALRVDLPLDGEPESWKGRPDGVTKELRALQATGLIYQSGTEGRWETRIYSITPEDQIEKMATKFKRKQPKLRKRDMSGSATQIADYRRQEKEAGITARRDVIEERRRIVELGVCARRLLPMVYWSEKNFPHDEKELVYDQALLTLTSLQKLVASLDATRANKQLREKIRALRAKADSVLELGNPEEAKLFREKASELETELDKAA